MLDLDALAPQVRDMVDKKTEEDQGESVFGPIIYSYTRAQALGDGVLVDVSEVGREAGISSPIALTQRVWAEVVIPPEKARQQGESEEGRLWDILWMCKWTAICRNPSALADVSGDTLRFKVRATMPGKFSSRLVDLKAVNGPGDDGEPVITIMFPDED